MVFGELIRVFGVSQIGGVSRTKTFSVGQKLITAGLFSHVRNPLYLGNLFLSSGIVIFSNVSLLFTLLFIVLFFLQYIPIVYWEESNLKNIFGAEYEEYAQKVPRWLPLLVPKIIIRKNQKRNFWGALVSEKYTLFAAVTLYVLIWWRSGWLVI